MPCASMRRELFALHLPNPERVQADNAVLAALSRGLSGGDILNVCVNAIHAGSVDADPAKWQVTHVMLERKISKQMSVEPSIHPSRIPWDQFTEGERKGSRAGKEGAWFAELRTCCCVPI